MNTSISFKKWFVLGATLIIISLIVSLIPSIFLGSIKGRTDHLLLQDELTEAEEQMKLDLEWSEIWWETQQATIFNPVALVLFAISLCVIIYGLIAKFGW